MTQAEQQLDIRDVVREHYATVYRYALRLSGAPADAEDLSQQAFLVAHQRLHQVREPEHVDRWLMAICRSCFLKSVRVKRPHIASSIDFELGTIPDAPSDDDIDRELLANALKELSDDFRVVVLMFYFEDLSYIEIAAQLNIPIGTVMSRLSRAKQHLRTSLSRHVTASPSSVPTSAANICLQTESSPTGATRPIPFVQS